MPRPAPIKVPLTVEQQKRLNAQYKIWGYPLSECINIEQFEAHLKSAFKKWGSPTEDETYLLKILEIYQIFDKTDFSQIETKHFVDDLSTFIAPVASKPKHFDLLKHVIDQQCQRIFNECYSAIQKNNGRLSKQIKVTLVSQVIKCYQALGIGSYCYHGSNTRLRNIFIHSLAKKRNNAQPFQSIIEVLGTHRLLSFFRETRSKQEMAHVLFGVGGMDSLKSQLLASSQPASAA
jgi:hypothetical protein